MENKKTTIYYFSATGNSLYVAKKLADNLGNCSVYSMPYYKSKEQIGGVNERIGFVFPSYYGELPRIVRKFIDELHIHPDTWIFGVSTMGIFLGTGSIAALEKVLKEKGVTLSYGCGVTMPRNYIINYNPLSAETAMKYNAKADRRVEQIADDIKARKNKISKNFITAKNLYRNIESLDVKFHVENQCTSCGQCEKICPVQNIKLVNARPEWQHHCEHCVACIHWCPKQAIQYSTKSKKRRRYHNPEIRLSDLININEYGDQNK